MPVIAKGCALFSPKGSEPRCIQRLHLLPLCRSRIGKQRRWLLNPDSSLGEDLDLGIGTVPEIVTRLAPTQADHARGDGSIPGGERIVVSYQVQLSLLRFVVACRAVVPCTTVAGCDINLILRRSRRPRILQAYTLPQQVNGPRLRI
jgi:hypothetical protein